MRSHSSVSLLDACEASLCRVPRLVGTYSEMAMVAFVNQSFAPAGRGTVNSALPVQNLDGQGDAMHRWEAVYFETWVTPSTAGPSC